MKPLITPINPQETICHTVQTPIPNMILDKKVVKMASKIAEIGPSMSPQIMMSDVTGLTLGKKTNKARPTTASVASKANTVNLYIFNYINSIFENRISLSHQPTIHIQLHRL